VALKTVLLVIGILLARVVPQQSPEYVTHGHDTVTQFAPARERGTLWFLAHNHEAGAYWSRALIGQATLIVDEQGNTRIYRIDKALQFRAIYPNNPYGDLIDLDTGKRMTAGEVFEKIIDEPGDLVLQTCIEVNGQPDWGRLFLLGHEVEKPNRHFMIARKMLPVD
jgi:hypothetical protein